MWHFVIASWPTCFRATSRGSLDPFLLYVFHCTRPTVTWIAIKKRNGDQTENNWTENNYLRRLKWTTKQHYHWYQRIIPMSDYKNYVDHAVSFSQRKYLASRVYVQVDFRFLCRIRTTCWWWWLEEAFPLSFFASRRLRTPSPALQLNVKKRKKIKIVAANLQIENVKLCSR